MWHFSMNIIFLLLLVRRSLEQKPKECGVQKIKVKDMIYSGYDTYHGQFPWHVAIFHKNLRNGNFEYACGGSLISSTFVLTAKHCIKDTEQMLAYLGIHNIVKFGSNYQIHSINKTHTVPRIGRWARLRNDIALFKLNASVGFTDYIQPICLNTLEQSKVKDAVVVGWGRSERGVLPETLKAASMPIVDHVECFESDRDVFGQVLEHGMICAGHLNGTSVSAGDSGGGLVVKRCFVSRCSWSLVGVVSFAAGNVAGYAKHHGYGVFTDVQMYLPWIEKITNITFADDISDGACGQRLNDSLRSRWPWHGTLYRIDSQPLVSTQDVTEGFGVSILTDQFVITAASVYKIVVLAPEKYRLRFGSPGNGLSDGYTQTMPIEATYIESININNEEVYQDLALFKLKGRLTFSKYVQPVCLWNEQEPDIPNMFLKFVSLFVQPETNVSIDLHQMTYFLSHDKSAPQNTPDEIKMQILPMAFCVKEKIWTTNFDDLFLCSQTTQMNEHGPQFWDIGTGLVMQKDDKWYLRGIYSDGYRGQYKPSLKDNHTMFLNVQFYYNMIVHKIDAYSFKYD